MSLKVGDRVRLKDGCRWFNEGNNPKSTAVRGIIIEINGDRTLPIQVEWFIDVNGFFTRFKNTYYRTDLVKVDGEPWDGNVLKFKFIMDLKVGDIVIYDRGVYGQFRSFLYDRLHIITKIEGTIISTQGHGWDYKTFGYSSELNTSDPALQKAIKLSVPRVHSGSSLKFNFIHR